MCVSTGWTRLGIGGQALNRKKAPASRHKTECELVRSAMVETEAGRTEARAPAGGAAWHPERPRVQGMKKEAV